MKTMSIKKKTDAELQKEVLLELKWDPRVDETEVGVQVKSGVVTLTGQIDSYGKRFAASKAAHRVAGVLDVANDLEVVPRDRHARTDADIAKAVREALRWNVFVPDKDITSTVSRGWVTLEGTVESWHEKDAAARAVRDLAGVQRVTNQILVEAPKANAKQVRESIEDALSRQAEFEADRVEVSVVDGVVTLSGTVRSWSERSAVERAARYTHGVGRVEDNLRIDSFS